MKPILVFLRLASPCFFSAVLLTLVILPLKGQVNPRIAPPNLKAYAIFEARALNVITDARSYSESFRFFFDIAFDSTFTNMVPGWNNRELSNVKSTLAGNAESVLLWGIIPGTTYYIRGKIGIDPLGTSPYSKTTSATIPAYDLPALLPIKALDSTSAIVEWIPYKDIPFYRLKITSFPSSFETACNEQFINDTILVPNTYRNQGRLLTAVRDSAQGKLLAVSRDTVQGLTPRMLYRFHLFIDTTQQSTIGVPFQYLQPSFGAYGKEAENRNRLNSGEKFLPLGSFRSLPQPQHISYYNAPLVNDSSRYFTISDSNNINSSAYIPQNYISPRIMYEKVLARLDSMKSLGIPIDTAYTALEGMLGVYGTIQPLPTGTECYFARVICVFTLRRPDTRVTQFARPGNGWRSFSWDTDYRRFIFPTTTSVRDENTAFVSGTPTLQSNPNPFTDETTITYTLPSEASTKVEVFSTLGQRMAVFSMERHVAGTYTIPLQATQWASGTYLIRLTLSDALGGIRTITHKISLLH